MFRGGQPVDARRARLRAHTPCRTLVAHGADGADLALVAQAAPEWVAKRFDRMVIASGDGIFAARAEATSTSASRSSAASATCRRGSAGSTPRPCSLAA